jgi:hypothetical protein
VRFACEGGLGSINRRRCNLEAALDPSRAVWQFALTKTQAAKECYDAAEDYDEQEAQAAGRFLAIAPFREIIAAASPARGKHRLCHLERYACDVPALTPLIASLCLATTQITADSITLPWVASGLYKVFLDSESLPAHEPRAAECASAQGYRRR